MSYRLIGKGNLGLRLQSLFKHNMWDECATHAKVVCIAVKPKDVKTVCDEIVTELNKNQIVVSCAAGVNVETLEGYLPQAQIVRCMPNICVSEWAGAVVWYRGARSMHKDISGNAMSNLSGLMQGPTQIWVKEESAIDRATVLFASQPAINAETAKVYIDIAMASGFTEDYARTLYASTLIGTGKLLFKNSPDKIINEVCSEGGVTEQALKTINNGNVNGILKKSVYDAFTHLGSMTKRLN